MAPKKVMKTMKKKGLEKSKKGLGKPKQDLEKSKKDLEKSKLNQENLEKLGQLSLQEKMANAAEQSESPEDAAIVLYKSMTKEEKAKAWSKHQTALKKKSKEERAEHEGLAKKEKGIAAAAYILEKEGRQYMVALKKASHSETAKQKDNWQSEPQMLGKWTAQELDKHIQSGRIHWRECPGTRGVFEYKDTQDYEGELPWKRQTEFQHGKEHEPEDEDLEKFLELIDQDWSSLSLDDKPKGLGKGKGLGKDPRAKAKANKKNLSDVKKPGKAGIMDETDLGKVLQACKKARNMVSSSKDDLEMALEKAKGQLSKNGQSNANSLLSELGKALGQLKTCLSKQNPDVTKLKETLMSVANVIKSAKDGTKELRQLANKAASVAGSRSAK